MSEKNYLIISAEKRRKWDFREVFCYFNLLYNFILRDIKIKYKQTFVGFFWVILQPLLTTGIFTLIFGKIAKLPSENIPYSLFVFSGMLPWFLFSKGLLKATDSIVIDQALITKIYFPRVLLPLASCFSSLFDLIFPFILFLLMLPFFSVGFSIKMLLAPVLVILTFLLTFSLGLIFSASSVYYRDFRNIIPFIVQFLQFLCPIGYSSALIAPKYSLFYKLNPMVGIIEGFRWSFFDQQAFPMESFGISCISILFLVIFSMVFFKKMENFFADII